MCTSVCTYLRLNITLNFAATMVQETMQEVLPCRTPCPGLPSMAALVEATNAHRRARRPKDPLDLNFSLLDEHVPAGFVRADIQIDGGRHIVMATDNQLKLLSQAKTWYWDATFKLIKAPFVQLFSVHGFVRKDDHVKQVDNLFYAMPNICMVRMLYAFAHSIYLQPIFYDIYRFHLRLC